jgi:hypothetical protein
MPQYTEDDLVQALIDVANGKSKQLAAKEWGVPHSTNRDRIKGSESHSSAGESQQRLSRAQEDHLANWVLTQEALGVPLTHAQIKEFAQRLLVLKGDHKSLGKRWIQAFLRRNPIATDSAAKGGVSQILELELDPQPEPEPETKVARAAKEVIKGRGKRGRKRKSAALEADEPELEPELEVARMI